MVNNSGKKNKQTTITNNKKQLRRSRSPVKRSKSPTKRSKTPQHKIQTGGSNISNQPDISGGSESSRLSNILLNVLLFLLIVLALYCVYTIIFSGNNKNNKKDILDDDSISSLETNNSDNQINRLANINNNSKDKNFIERLTDNFVDNNREVRLKNLNININTSDASAKGYLVNKAHERIVNPLLPPERSYENTYGVPINIPSRGYAGGYQQIGYLYKDEITDETKKIGNNSESVIIPLYGAPTYNGSNRWNYYVSSDKFHTVKIPFTLNGRSSDDEHGIPEIFDGEQLQLPPYNGDFKIKIYKYDKPRYIPYIF